MYTQPSTSPKRQYIATAIFAILAMVSAMSIVSQQKNNRVQFQTVSLEQDNQHSQTLEELSLQEHLKHNKQ